MQYLKRISALIFSLCILSGITSGQSDQYKKNLLIYKDTNGQCIPVKNKKDWNKRRAQILDSMQQVMGQLPDLSRKVPPDIQILEETNVEGIRRLKITFAVEKHDRVPAWLLIPAGNKKPVPGLLCLHQTISIGKSEPAGIEGSPNLHYALELAKHEIPDCPEVDSMVKFFEDSKRGVALRTVEEVNGD